MLTAWFHKFLKVYIPFSSQQPLSMYGSCPLTQIISPATFQIPLSTPPQQPLFLIPVNIHQFGQFFNFVTIREITMCTFMSAFFAERYLLIPQTLISGCVGIQGRPWNEAHWSMGEFFWCPQSRHPGIKVHSSEHGFLCNIMGKLLS